jgi:hypothetical protein
MFISGGLLFWLAEETHPRINPSEAAERIGARVVSGDP